MGSPVVSSADVPQRPCSGVAQPQSCMKESLTDTTLTLTIDRTACSCRASKKSTLLELLLHLHITIGAIELQRTSECSSTGRARCAMQPPSRRRHADTSPPCRQQGVDRSSRRAAPASLHSRMCRLRTVQACLGMNFLHVVPPSIFRGTRSDASRGLPRLSIDH